MVGMDSSFVFVDDVPPSKTIPLKRYPISTQIIPPYAHDWRVSTTGGIRISGRYFIDKDGRVCGLRGVNLSGSCKTPSNDDYDMLYDKHQQVTFVNRPFPLSEAPEHFARLRRWGLTFVRFLVTWEAIEHEGPGKYDTDYLQYLKSILSLLPEYGMVAFVSMHQDVWSRYTGGSGAPGWTITSVGFDLDKLEETGAAWLKGVRGGGHSEEERGLWPCGYQKLSAATMATLFWGGDTFAPKMKIDGTPIQQYLQSAYLNAWQVLVRYVGSLDGVLGFEMMNEPHRGYIEVPSMHAFDYTTDLHLAYVPSALQSFALGAGHATRVPHWSRSFPMPTKLTRHEVLNQGEVCVWRPDGPTEGKCVWEWHGVWGWDRKKEEAVVLRESYFTKNPLTGKKIDWYTDFYYPFLQRWTNVVRSASSPDKLIFTEAIPNEFCPSSWTLEKRPPNMVYAPHWYDLNGLFRKAFGDFSVNVQGLARGMFPLKAFYWGQKGARENFSLQIRNIVKAAYESLGETPVIIGECGIPMDMNQGEAFRSDNWTWQARMMDAMITGLESSLVGYTLWNYNPYNNDTAGDHWNGENFSWFSRERSSVARNSEATYKVYDQTDASFDEGGRILRAIVRPYPAKTAGIPISFEYEMNTGKVLFEWATPKPRTDAKLGTKLSALHDIQAVAHELKSKETMIFLPSMLTQGRKVLVKGLGRDDEYSYNESQQTLSIRTVDNGPGSHHKIEITLNPPLQELFIVNDFSSDFRLWILSVGVLILGIGYYFLAF